MTLHRDPVRYGDVGFGKVGGDRYEVTREGHLLFVGFGLGLFSLKISARLSWAGFFTGASIKTNFIF